jgi:two-component system, OmpR family, response regulator
MIDELKAMSDQVCVGSSGVCQSSVLVVDHDEILRRALARVLRAAGYIVLHAEDGFAALELLGLMRFDLVLTDLRMSRMSGIELMHQMRLQGIETRAIVMSDQEHAREELLAAGAVAHLRKPFSNAALIAVAREATRGGSVN